MSKPHPSPLVRLILAAAARGKSILAQREKATREKQSKPDPKNSKDLKP